jgi:hypothetical protein
MVMEIYISFILIKKILIMFDYRLHLKKLTIFKIKFFLIIIIIFEIGIFIIRITFPNPSPEGHIRILGFVARLLILVDFYYDVIYDITANTEGIRMKNFTFPEFKNKENSGKEFIETI